MTRDQLEDVLGDTMVSVYRLHYEWHGPNEAKEHLMQALAHLAYADAMWKAMSEDKMGGDSEL